jgi:hypothetical protein
MLIRGGCHCGNIRLELSWLPEPSQIPARACGCSFCVKHGGVWTSCAQGALRVILREPAQVEHYSFGTCTADFHICRICGVVPLVTSRIEGELYAVVNVNTLEGLDEQLLSRAPASFEGEDEAQRLARRRRNWIPAVRFA